MRWMTLMAVILCAGVIQAWGAEEDAPFAACWGLSRTAKTTGFTAGAIDKGTVFDCTSGSFTIAFTAAATLGAGWHCAVYDSGAGSIVLDPNAAETIQSPAGTATTLTLTQGQGVVLECNGAGFQVVAASGLLGSGVLAPTFGGTGQSTYALGDTLYSDATNSLAKLAGNTTATKKFLNQTGTGAVSAAPAWSALVAADIPGTLGATTFSASVTMTDAFNLILGTTTGSKIGTGTTQKLGFFNATPVVQQTGDVATALNTLGLTTGATVTVSTANISDYSTGTFTPTVAGSSTAGTQTYSVQSGAYTVIGNRVFFSLDVLMTAKDGATAGNILVKGLPFARNSSPPYDVLNLQTAVVTLTGGKFTMDADMVSTSSDIEIIELASAGARASMPVANLAATSEFIITGVYRK